jgi:ankyrin repeat protein
MLIDHGADINAVNNSEGNYDGVNMLLDQGADINAVCDSRKTALHAAFERPRLFP